MELMPIDDQIRKLKALEEKIIRVSGNPLALLSFLQSEGLGVFLELLAIAHSQALLIRDINGRLSNVESKK
jgi:hypothetical protein